MYGQVEKKPIPEASDELKKKTNWMQCVVQNKTQFMIVHDPPAYFDSGRYQDSPKNIEPYENMVFSVCNRDLEPTGAIGGATFRIILDAVAEVPFALVSGSVLQCLDFHSRGQLMSLFS